MNRRRLNSARAYFRLAAKADMQRQHDQAASYRRRAERLVEEDRREREARALRKASK